MKTHVDHGMEITERAGWLKDAQAVVGSHHEKYDGAGDPAGLKGEAGRRRQGGRRQRSRCRLSWWGWRR